MCRMSPYLLLVYGVPPGLCYSNPAVLGLTAEATTCHHFVAGSSGLRSYSLVNYDCVHRLNFGVVWKQRNAEPAEQRSIEKVEDRNEQQNQQCAGY